MDPAPIDAFYERLAQVSFTVLSLWLVVAQLRRADFARDPAARRVGHAISLQFALPALMSLLALVDPRDPAMWRTSFTAAALFGLVALVALYVSLPRGDRGPLVRVACGVGGLLYLLIGLVALAPRAPARLFPALTGIETEGILLAVLVFAGLNLLFVLMFERAEDPA